MRRAWIRWVFVSVFVSVLVWVVALDQRDAVAQSLELTSADRLAQLYSSQLVFDGQGTPMVRIGLAEGLESIEFEPQGILKVLPQGPGGAVIELPAKQRYKIALQKGQAGTYTHHIILERFDGEVSAKEISEAKSDWQKRGVLAPETLELGSLFAISGEMFDTRQTLLVTPASPDAAGVERQRVALEEAAGEELGLHSELKHFPGAELVLTSDDFPVRITHRDLLWLDTGNAPIHVTGLPGDKDKAAADTQEQQFLGSLILAPDREGRLAVILAAPIEEILRGVVPAETYPSAPLDALKVQAVAARGTILAQIGARHLADPFHLCNKQHCQVFKGLAATTESTDKAVAQTRGQVLMHDRHIAETFYSSNCGGQSETPDDVWGQSPRAYLTAHLDAASSGAPATDIDALLKTTPSGAWCNTQAFGSGKHFRWEQRLSADDLQRHVNAKHDIGPILDLKILARGKGGRAMQMEIKGQKGTVVVERELAIRRVFGGLKSALFTLDIAYDKKGRVEEVTFKGAGFGHGVGMCQTGAMGMAQAGHDHKKILNHYYPGTKLDALW